MTHVARSTLIIAFFFGIDKVLGFVRQIFIARQFALSYDIDAFNAANNIPDLLSALISGGALGVALIPVLSEYMTKYGRKDAWDLFVRILNLAFLVTAALAILVAIFAWPIVQVLIVPSFPYEQQALTVELMRLDLMAILIFSISGLAMAGLQANQHFLLPALAPGLYNIGQIFGVVVLARPEGLQLGPITLPAFGMGIHGLVYGVILGALLHLAIQVPGLLRFGFRWAPVINLRHPGVRHVLLLLGPRVLTMFFLQVYFVARDNLASGMGEGAVTALNYGWFIMQVPETLIGTAIAIAMLPTLSEMMARGDHAGFARALNSAVRTLLALTVPIAALLAIALPPLVSALFDFGTEGTLLVVWITRAYLLGLTGHTLLEISARSFYARQDAITPLWVGGLNTVVFFVLAITLSPRLGPAGIALSNTLAFTSEALLLLFLLNRRAPGILKVSRTLVRVALVTVGAAAITYAIMLIPVGDRDLYRAGLAFIAMAVAALAALPFLWPEIRLLLRLGGAAPLAPAVEPVVDPVQG